MATIAANSYPLEFNFIDNPIVVGIENMSFPTESTFRQVVIEVAVTPSISYSQQSTYTFRIDASSSDTLWVDISTVLRAVMNTDKYIPEPKYLYQSGALATSYSYISATFTLKAHEEYMLDGEVYTNAGVSREAACAYYGGISEYDRLAIQAHPADFIGGMVLSRKPTSGELWGTGDINIINKVETASDGSFYTKANIERITDGFLPTGKYHHFMFINSFGVLETCSAWCKESLSYGIQSEQKSLVTAPSFHPAPNITTHKTGNRPHFEMSSGPVSVEWADWWTTEFLMAKRYWVYMGTTKKLSTGDNPTWVETPLWLPCTITPADDTIVIYDKAEQAYPHVDFNVDVAVSGSLKSGLKL